MAFLIHAYRKLFLKGKINDLEYRQMMLSQQKQQITEQVGMMQQAMSMAKNAMSIFTSSAMQGINNDIYSKYKGADGKINIPEADKADIENQLRTKQMELMTSSYAANSVFEYTSTAMMQPLKCADTAMDLEMASLESQLKTLRPELESVEKAESEAAKSEAPKFGLT